MWAPLSSGDSPGVGLSAAVPCAPLARHFFTKQTTKQVFYSGVNGEKVEGMEGSALLHFKVCF